MLKRGYHGAFQWFSAKHRDRYVAAFAGRANIRPLHTADRMAWITRRMSGKHSGTGISSLEGGRANGLWRILPLYVINCYYGKVGAQ